MKQFSLLFLLFSFTVCFSQVNEQTIVGKWQEISQNGGNGGGKFYTNYIENGEIFIFNKNKIFQNIAGKTFKEETGKVGKYKFMHDQLEISIYNQKFYGLVYFNQKNFNIVTFNPTNSKYELICDEGCSITYQKIK